MEFELLREFMYIYIQLLPYCYEFGGMKFSKHQLPSFEYFKRTYNDTAYSLIIPHYKESIDLKEGRVFPLYAHGICSYEGIAYRSYNIWHGAKYYPVTEEFTLKTDRIQKELQMFKNK